MITICLADDHQVVRQGLRALLNAEADFSVVGEAGDGLDAIQMVEKLKPHALVVDLMMPGVGGLEVVRQISRRQPQCAIVVLSMYEDESYVLEALRTGALGYVLKGSSAEELVTAVRQVVAGQRFLSEQLVAEGIDFYILQANEKPEDPYETLTPREREVLHLSTQGMNNTEVAKKLFISPRTVETHRANMMRKLDLHNQTELIRYAIRRGILPMDQ